MFLIIHLSHKLTLRIGKQNIKVQTTIIFQTTELTED